jgi:hypothetical protein
MIIDLNDLPKYASQALQKPEDFGYWGDDDMFVTWGFTGIDVNDASDLLERSNFKVISNKLMEMYPGDFRIETYKHWAVNSVDRLVCRILKEPGDITDQNITKAFYAAMKWHNELDEYPIADENEFLEMEYLEAINTLHELPDYLKELIDLDNSDWVVLLYEELSSNMGIDINFAYPFDEDIQKAIYQANICNPEEIEKWNSWADMHDLPRPNLKKENPNQLKLFED